MGNAPPAPAKAAPRPPERARPKKGAAAKKKKAGTRTPQKHYPDSTEESYSESYYEDRRTAPEEVKKYKSLKNAFAAHPESRRHVTYKDMMRNDRTDRMIKSFDNPQKMLSYCRDHMDKFPYDVVRLDNGTYRIISQEDGDNVKDILKLRNDEGDRLKAGHTTLSKKKERVVYAGEIIFDRSYGLSINRYSGHYFHDLEDYDDFRKAKNQIGKELLEYFYTKDNRKRKKKNKKRH